jgi:cellulose synthase (UDP-forming)
MRNPAAPGADGDSVGQAGVRGSAPTRSRGRAAVPSRVINERVFGHRHIPLYAALSVLNLVVAGWAVAYWLGHATWSAHTPVYLLLTASLLVAVAMFESRWFALPIMRRPRPMAASAGWRVGVATTFVPGAEEREMLERTVRALVAMEYPHDTWVLDEGDDPAVRAMCRRLGAHHFSRNGMPRYEHARGTFESRTKHGNYNAWLHAEGYANYDIISAFDPDHVPVRSFLTRVLGYFDDPSVGYVQAPQFYYNQNASFVARGAAEETYAYYSSIQMSSYAIGYPIVTGCHNTHRVAALSKVGGFAAHEADDLLITMHYRGAGWRGVYVPERLAAGLTPVDMAGYLTQQRRWARSVLDIKMRIFPKVGRALSLPERVFSLVHGLYYLHGLASALGTALVSFMLLTGSAPAVVSMGTAKRVIVLFVVFQLCDLFRQHFFLDPARERGIHWRAGLLRVAKWPHVLLALGDALSGPNRGYTITRKSRSTDKQYLAAPVHLLVAGIVACAWAAGAARGVPHNPALDVGAALIISLSLVVALSEFRRFPPPYDDDLAALALAGDRHSRPASRVE